MKRRGALGGSGGQRAPITVLLAYLLLVPVAVGACDAPAPPREPLPTSASHNGLNAPDPPDLPPMATPRRALGAAFHQGQLYVAGGWNGESTQLSVLEIYDPVRRQWRGGPSLAQPRSQHSLVSTGNQLWVVGGWSADEGLISAVEVLDDAAGPWRTVTHLPTPRREPGVARLAGEIVVAGGFDGRSDAEQDGYLARVEAYDPVLDRWRRLASLRHPRRGLNLVTVDGMLYAVGGYGPDAPGFLSSVEQYDAETDRWETLAWQTAPRTWTSALAVPGSQGSELLIAGGFNQSGFLDLVERVDPLSGKICHPPPLSMARAWFGAALTPDGLLAVGGETADGFSAALTLEATACPP